jgi:hypothetical protein
MQQAFEGVKDTPRRLLEIGKGSMIEFNARLKTNATDNKNE